MSRTWAGFREAVAHGLGIVVERALKPAPRVARHWESTARLAWFGAAADHHFVHASWSFGRLRDIAPVEGKRQTVGVFAMTKATFPGFDDEGLRAQLDALIPPTTDGATKVFLHRVTMQLATADALLALGERIGCETSLCARIDAVDLDAVTPRWPEHARDRVTAALTLMDEALAKRCVALWAAPSEVLLTAARESVT